MNAGIQHDETAWREGWKAGATGKPNRNPYPADDPRGLAWISGYIEGKAKPDTVPQMRPLPVKDLPG